MEQKDISTMPSFEKVTIVLTPEIVSFVREAVDSGEYASSSEVIREALREWRQKRLLQLQNLEELRRFWGMRKKGIQQC